MTMQHCPVHATPRPNRDEPQAAATPVRAEPVRPFSEIPRLKSTSLLGGSLRDFARDPLELLERAQSSHGDLVQVRMGTRPYLLVSDPDAIDHILTRRHQNYTKATRGYAMLRKFLGDGLLTSNGETWRTHRRLVQPAFRRDRVRGFAGLISSSAGELVESWREKARAGEATDVQDDLMQVTLRIIGMTMLSVDLREGASQLGRDVTTCLRRTNEYLTALPGAHLAPTRKNRAFKRAKRSLDRGVMQIIDERRRRMSRGEEIPTDVLSLLLSARDPESGRMLSDENLRDEVLAILLAGHETTANTLSWTLQLLAQHPFVRERLQAELDAAGDDALGAEALERLPYCRQVLLESMRLRPAIWLFGRKSVEDDCLLGYHVPAGTSHFVSPWLVHRHPDHWEAPLRFDPDRFGRSGSEVRRGAYIPFIQGPRQCIGKDFAMLESQILLAVTCRAIQADGIAGHDVVPEPWVTLRPKNGLPMRLRVRD